MILLLVGPVIILPDTQEINPCTRAAYDAEHEVQRTYAMVAALYDGDQVKIDNYVYCYGQLTGIQILPEAPDRLSNREKIFLGVLVGLVIGAIVVSGWLEPSIDLNMSGGDSGAWVGM